MIELDDLGANLVACLLLSLRVGPLFILSPPFTLTRWPMQARVFLALALAAWLSDSRGPFIARGVLGLGHLVELAAAELLIGLLFALALQIMASAFYFVGRLIDIQAGFGLAVVIDPTTKNQTALIGTLLIYLFGSLFFATGGHYELLRMLASSVDLLPLGQFPTGVTASRLAGALSAMLLAGLGIGGGVIVCLFLADTAIALMSRTIPQMNVLVLGLQVKSLLLLLVLPMTLAPASTIMLRMTSMMFVELARWL